MTSSIKPADLGSELENCFASMWVDSAGSSQHFNPGPEIGLIAASLTTQFNDFCQSTIAKYAFTDGVSHLSFQFLARREINAYAFRREGKAFVAVNFGVPEALLDTARRLVGHPEVRGVFAEIYSDALEADNLAALIMVSGVTFIFAHEIAHHYSAHLHHLRPGNRRAILDESLDELKSATDAFLDRQALEVQADSFAVSRSLENLNDPAWRDDAMDLLGIKTGQLEAVRLCATSLAIALLIIFLKLRFSKTVENSNTNLISETDHPTPRHRLIHGLSCITNESVFDSFPPKSVRELLNAIERAWPAPGLWNWVYYGNDVNESAEAHSYLTSLWTRADALETQLKDFRWR